MRNAFTTTVYIVVLFTAGSSSLLMASGNALDTPFYLSSGYLKQTTDSSPVIGEKNLLPLSEPLRKLEQDEPIQLSLSDYLNIAQQRNYDIRLAREVLVQADTKIAQARSAMLPFVGIEGSYSRLDEELGFTLGPQSLTFMDQNIYKTGVVVRQPLFMGGRLTAARKASQYSRDAQEQENKAIEEEIIFQVTRVYRTSQLAEVFQNVAVEAVELLEAHEHDVAILVREGANPEIDLLRTQTELANARKELNSANNAVDLAHSALKNLLNIPLEKLVSLTEVLERISWTKEDQYGPSF